MFCSKNWELKQCQVSGLAFVLPCVGQVHLFHQNRNRPKRPPSVSCLDSKGSQRSGREKQARPTGQTYHMYKHVLFHPKAKNISKYCKVKCKMPFERGSSGSHWNGTYSGLLLIWSNLAHAVNPNTLSFHRKTKNKKLKLLEPVHCQTANLTKNDGMNGLLVVSSSNEETKTLGNLQFKLHPFEPL